MTAEIMGNQVERVYDVGVAGIHRLFDKLDLIRNANVVYCRCRRKALWQALSAAWSNDL